jgi:hypothetical protein
MDIINQLTSDEKVFGKMSDPITPSYQLVNQSNFFLLERRMSELQILYWTYFSKTNVRRKKSHKLNTSKKKFLQLEKLEFLIILSHTSQI